MWSVQGDQRGRGQYNRSNRGGRGRGGRFRGRRGNYGGRGSNGHNHRERGDERERAAYTDANTGRSRSRTPRHMYQSSRYTTHQVNQTFPNSHASIPIYRPIRPLDPKLTICVLTNLPTNLQLHYHSLQPATCRSLAGSESRITSIPTYSIVTDQS